MGTIGGPDDKAWAVGTIGGPDDKTRAVPEVKGNGLEGSGAIGGHYWWTLEQALHPAPWNKA